MIKIVEPNDGKNWARLIVNRMEYGRKYCSYSQRLAREVLHLPELEPKHHLRLDSQVDVNRSSAAKPQTKPMASPDPTSTWLGESEFT